MKKFIALICLTAVLTGCGNASGSSSSKQEKTSAEPATEVTTEDVQDGPSDEIFNMEASYRNTLEELKKEGAESFSLCDLSGGIGPEILAVRVKDGDVNRIKLYRYDQNNGESKLLGTFDNYISYFAGSNTLSYGTYDSNTRVDTTTYFHISDDGELVTDSDFRHSYASEEEGAENFWKGEETITESDYLEYMSSINIGPVRDLGSDFKLEDDIINAVLSDTGTWQDNYSKYLLSCLPDVSEEDNAGFSVMDINGDDIPELFYASGYYHVSPVTVLTMKNGSLRCLGNFGSYGSVMYYPDSKELLSGNMGMGYYSGAYYTLGSDGKFTLDLSFNDDSGAVDPEGTQKPVYNINNSPVDEKTYRDTLNSHSNKPGYSLGTDNELTEENIKALAGGKYDPAELYDPTSLQNTPVAAEDIPDRYKQILSKFYYSCQLDLTPIEITGSNNISDNTFAVYDVDCDGKDELIINVTATSMAEMVTVIYGEDSSGDVKVELLTAPFYTVYDNGNIEVDDSHNQGISGRFWPYTVYHYDASSNDYKFYKYISAWDKEMYPEGFPEEFDKDGDGMVYYINADYVDSNVDPVDSDVFDKWRSDERNGAMPVNIPTQNITEDVIS